MAGDAAANRKSANSTALAVCEALLADVAVPTVSSVVQTAGIASGSSVIQKISAKDHGIWRQAEINVTGLAGFLLAKMAAAHGRRKAKDWYDIAFVLLNNGHGGPSAAAQRVIEIFGQSVISPIRTQVLDLQANFATADAQGTAAYADQITLDHPELDRVTAAADAQLAVAAFTERLLA
jgi:Nucleotidyl transferase AbiEii toxin, Type IV TA system